jgi:hypothetical protein
VTRHARRPLTGVLGRAETLGAAHEALGTPPLTRDALSRHFEDELEGDGAPSLDAVVRVYDETRAWIALRRDAGGEGR